MVKMPHWPAPNLVLPASESPKRMQCLLAKMGSPQLAVPPVVHVTGTNGKGSVVAFLKHILQQAGYKVHAYTSPHIFHYNERVILRGSPIDNGALHYYIEKARLAADEMPLTFFEATTAAAFAAFSETPADILLTEVGMGGAWDATNVFPDVAATIITSISLDHCEYLGSSLFDIATHKMGISKANRPCIIGPQPQELSLYLKNLAQHLGCYPFIHGVDWWYEGTPGGFNFIDEEEMAFRAPGLLGTHQIANAATALAALQCLPNFMVTHGQIDLGLATTQWPGRLQHITKGKLAASLPASWQLWMDGAHNVGGSAALAANLAPWTDHKIVLVNGRTAGRDIDGFLQPFADKVASVLAVPVKGEPNSEDPRLIAAAARGLGIAEVHVCSSVGDAIAFCLAHYPPQMPLVILATGSLYLLADIMLDLS